MNTTALVITAVLTVVFVGILIFVCLMVKKKATIQVEEEVATAESTSEFMPFDDIDNSMIVCANHTYKAIIECSSINLGLCSGMEVQRIQDSYYQLMDSINFPFSMYIITKEIDNEKMLKRFEELSEDPLMRYPSLTEYYEQYRQDLATLPTICGNSKQKKKYILITYDEANTMDKLTDDEKFYYSAKELGNRCNVFIDGLSRVGISAHILNSDEIADLLYSVYHKESLSSANNIIEGDYSSLVVEGHEGLQQASAYQFMDLSIAEAINEIKENVLNNKYIPEYDKLDAQEVLSKLSEIRDNYTGYYVNTIDQMEGGTNNE